MSKNDEKSYTIKISEPMEEMMILDNPDKDFQEKHYPSRHPANLPHSYRLYLSAPPSSGKGVIINQLLFHADPHFERVIVCHPCPENTLEWSDVVIDQADLRSTIPEASEYDPTQKTLLIIDDMDLSSGGLSKEQRKTLSTTLQFTSSHCNLSVIITNQQFTGLNIRFRRLCNMFMVGIQNNDVDSISLLWRKAVGHTVPKSVFNTLMKSFKSKHDLLFIDLSENSPWPIRKGLYQPIRIEED
jgi:hypothetical protein